LKKTVISIFLASILALPVFAEKLEPFILPTAASNGFGGTHVAYTDNVYALLVNPAAMMQVEEKSFFTLAPSLFSPERTIKIYRSISTSDMMNGDFSKLGEVFGNLGVNEGRIGFGAELRQFPLSIAWVANGFGFGVWERFYLYLNVIDLNFEVKTFMDVMVPVGFAFKILALENHSLDAGITIKPFARAIVHESESITSLIGSSELMEDWSVPVIVGGTFDLGLLYRWKHGIQFGLTFNDVYSRGTVFRNLLGDDNKSYYIPFTMNTGLSYNLKVLFFGLAFAVDWRNIGLADLQNLEAYFRREDYLRRSFLLDLGVGLQVSLFDAVYARAGISDMLPSAGLGLYLGPVKIDLAYYGKELGLQPGQLPVAVFDASVSIRPKAKERDWPWARRSIIGLFTGGE
jgi:hypothetical protein